MSLHAIAGVLAGVLAEMSPYELAAAFFGIVAVWLTTLENVWCWPIGLVNVGLYVLVFYEAKLYADMGLQVIYVALLVYGWWQWLHGGNGQGTLTVSRTPSRALGLLAALGVAGAAVLGLTLYRHTDAALPFWDSSLTSFSLVAQWMQARKWIENWPLWIVVDVVYVGMYVYKKLYLTAGLYAVFIGLAVLGLVQWRRSLAAAAA
jgi:nicotinamide mononucleotide transporter